MKKLFLSLLLSALSLCQLAAQEINIRSIEELTTVLRARTSPVYDNNGELCAFVEIAAPTLDGLEFDKEKTVGEILFSKGVYSLHIPAGTKKIGFRHDDFIPGMIDFSAYGIQITGGTTYRVVLERPINSSAVGFLLFRVSPRTAVLELDGEVLPVGNDGYAQKTVIVGRSYRYTALMRGYHPMEGIVAVSEAGRSEEIIIDLKEASGRLRIGDAGNASIIGASVYLDDELLPGTAPMMLDDITSGSHTVRIVRDLYKSVTATVQVMDSDETTFNPVLESNSATVNVEAPSGSEIWVDNVRKSSGSWTGELSTGTHIIEARVDGNVISSQLIELIASSQIQDITLSAMHSSIIVSSSPVKATVLLDGKEAGVTPVLIPDVEVGTHVVSLSKEGFSSVARTVQVGMDGDNEISFTLESAQSVEPLASVDVKSEAKGTVFLGGGVGVNYLKTYSMPDLSADIIAGYVKKFGGYVHFSKDFKADFKYSNYDSVIHVDRMSVSAGLASCLKRNSIYVLSGIGYLSRNFTMTQLLTQNVYEDNKVASLSADLNLLLRYEHLGFYLGATIPVQYQYTDFHAGFAVLF